MALFAYRRGVLVRKGQPIARVEPLASDPASVQTVDHSMRRAVRFLNDAEGVSGPPYFSPDASPLDRYKHAGYGAVILLLIGAGLLSGSLPGFLAFGVLAYLVSYIQPPR